MSSATDPAIQTSRDPEADLYRHLAFFNYKPDRPDEEDNFASRFSLGRRKHITDLLKHRHDGPCPTDDAEVWLEIVLPFVVEAAEIRGRSCYLDALNWAYIHVPLLVEQMGPEHVLDLTREVVVQRDEAVAMRAGEASSYLKWLPAMAQIRDALRPTYQEVTTLSFKGWSSIDPPSAEERKKANRLRMQSTRRAKGAKPQSERTKTKDAKHLAECLGVSLATIKRRKNEGTLVELIQQKIESGQLVERNPCIPYLMKEEAHTFSSRLAANDDTRATRSA